MEEAFREAAIQKCRGAEHFFAIAPPHRRWPASAGVLYKFCILSNSDQQASVGSTLWRFWEWATSFEHGAHTENDRVLKILVGSARCRSCARILGHARNAEKFSTPLKKTRTHKTAPRIWAGNAFFPPVTTFSFDLLVVSPKQSFVWE